MTSSAGSEDDIKKVKKQTSRKKNSGKDTTKSKKENENKDDQKKTHAAVRFLAPSVETKISVLDIKQLHYNANEPFTINSLCQAKKNPKDKIFNGVVQILALGEGLSRQIFPTSFNH